MIKIPIKFFFLISIFIFFLSNICAQTDSLSEQTTTGSSEELESFDEDFDSLFDEAEDSEVIVKDVKKKESIFSDFKPLPITFTGNLTSDAGFAYNYESTAIIDEYIRRYEQYNYYKGCYDSGKISYDDFVYLLKYHNITNNPDQLFSAEEQYDLFHRIEASSNISNGLSGYFTFTNKLYMNARPSNDFSIRGVMNISFPGYDWGLSEFYFDFIIRNSICLTAGKKATTWGYTRLFSQSTNSTTEYEVGGENTNILVDSGSGTSLMLRIPFWTGTITALGIYQGSSTSPSFSDMFFAGSVEMVIKKVSVNLFGRKEKSATGDTLGPLLGLEMKRTLFGADFYGQFLARTDSDSAFIDLFKGDVDYTKFQQFIFTGGFYRWWDKHDPHFGFNIEYQGNCSLYYENEKNPYYYLIEGQPEYNEVLEHSITHRIAYDIGIKRLGKKHNIKIGLEGSHVLNAKEGYIKPGIKFSGIFPYCDWTSGVKWEYGEYLPNEGRFTLGSYITISVNY